MNKIYEAIVGSQSYGTAIATSDLDIKGVYTQPLDDILGFGYTEQVNKGKDETYYEVKRFLQLLKTGNPTVLELLWSPEDCIKLTTPQFELIRANRDKFLTKKCRDSFGGYAVQQIKKARGLDKKMNWEKDRITKKDIMDFCYVIPKQEKDSVPLKEWLRKENKKQEHCGLSAINHCRYTYGLYYDHLAEMKSSNPRFEGGGFGYKGICGEDSNEVRVSSIPEYVVIEGVLVCNLDGYSSFCKDYTDYTSWIEKRNTTRYVDNKGHNQKIDSKNMLHCRRLIDMAMEIAQINTLQVRRPNAEYLLKIRRGEVNLNELIDKAEEDIKLIDELYEKSSIPEDVDEQFVNELLINIRKM